jgi:hypothetical protein
MAKDDSAQYDPALPQSGQSKRELGNLASVSPGDRFSPAKAAQLGLRAYFHTLLEGIPDIYLEADRASWITSRYFVRPPSDVTTDSSVWSTLCEAISDILKGAERTTGKHVSIETNDPWALWSYMGGYAHELKKYPLPVRDLEEYPRFQTTPISDNATCVPPVSGLARWEIDRLKRHFKTVYGRSGLIVAPLTLAQDATSFEVIPYRRSYREMLLQRAALESGVALTLVMDHIGWTPDPHHPPFWVCDEDFTWEYASRKYPVQIILPPAARVWQAALQKSGFVFVDYNRDDECSNMLVISNDRFQNFIP